MTTTMADAPVTEMATTPSESGSPLINRYRDGYRVGSALVALGNSIKIGGAVVAGLIALPALNSGSFAMVGLGIAAVSGGLFWISGVIVAAHGQTLQATLDTAVASSHFLTNHERAEAMGLPRSVADRGGR